MCIYAQFRYHNCHRRHNPGFGHRGGRPFLIASCVLYKTARPESKYTEPLVERGAVDIAYPCSQRSYRICIVQTDCPICEMRFTSDNSPLRRDYHVVGEGQLTWHVPYVQMMGVFRNVDFNAPRTDLRDDEDEDEEPESPVRPTFREIIWRMTKLSVVDERDGDSPVSPKSGAPT